jgi:hypothetical protein
MFAGQSLRLCRREASPVGPFGFGEMHVSRERRTQRLKGEMLE